LICGDIAGLNPQYDRDATTARVAARLVRPVALCGAVNQS
jgi:arginase family enzyme